MKIRASSLPAWRLTTLVAFFAAMALVFTYLWVNSGGRLPGVGHDYKVTLQSQDLQNLVENSDVMIAGVKVGSVLEITGRGENATAVVGLDESVAPLHEGATFALRSKTLVEETYVDITDGDGGEIDSSSAVVGEQLLCTSGRGAQRAEARGPSRAGELLARERCRDQAQVR